MDYVCDWRSRLSRSCALALWLPRNGSSRNNLAEREFNSLRKIRSRVSLNPAAGFVQRSYSDLEPAAGFVQRSYSDLEPERSLNLLCSPHAKEVAVRVQ